MRRLLITLFILLSCNTCFGQSSFQKLIPGTTTRSEVASVFGQPVRTISATLLEYAPPAGLAKVEAEYRAGSAIVERLEVYFVRPVSRQALVQQFALPQVAEKKTSIDGKLVEYFGGTSLLALTYASADTSSGVSRIGYYSRDLFEKVAGITSGARQPLNPVGGHRNSCFANDPGMASTNRTEHFNWAQHQSAARLSANLANKINLLFNCPSLASDQLSGAFSDLSVIIARGVRNYECFAGDRGALSEDWSAHKEWASTKSPSDVLSNLQRKMSTAFKCLRRSAQSSLFAASSVAIAKAALAGSGAASTQD